MRIKKTLGTTLTIVAILFYSHLAIAAETNSRTACESLAELSTPSFVVNSAEWIDASFQSTTELPAHCLFRVMLDPRESGIAGMGYGTGIELRLPQEWNGRLLFQGGGGLNGMLNPAYGTVANAPSALARGFVVVSTDGGHQGRSLIDARFGVDQQAKLDFAYQAVQRTTSEAKSLINKYYGHQPEYSYFMGCSTGGREAMMAAQRMPLEFDGIVAGNPSFNLTRIAINQVWSLQTVTRMAPLDEAGQPSLSNAFTDAQLQAVAATVLSQCDALDGLEDGMINDFQACPFDPASLSCDTNNDAASQQCLSTDQVTALKDIFGGARNSQGDSLYGAYTFDTGIAEPVWRSMHLGSGTNPPANASLGRDTLRLLSLTPPDPDLDPLNFNFDTALAATAETAAINDPVGALHSSFVENGGKMIVYHGLSDQAMSVGAITQWYETLLPQTEQGPQDWARLFLVPGMTHCGGGQSTDQFDMLTSIQQWVEDEQAPLKVIASGRAFPEVTRPLCPYPQVARYDGGDQNDEQSFSCR